MGCYISPNDASTIEDVVTATFRRPQRENLLVAVDFNVDMVDPEGSTRTEEIAAALETDGLEDIGANFLPRRKSWLSYGRTWSMWRSDRVLRSRTNYLMGMDRRLYQNVLVRDVRHNLDQYLVLGCLQGAPTREHVHYLGIRRYFPLQPPRNASTEDCLFSKLRGGVPKPLQMERICQEWISPDTWSLVDKIIAAIGAGYRDMCGSLAT